MRPQNRHESLVVTAVILAILAVLSYYFIDKLSGEEAVTVSNFEECVARGYPVMESYPRRCNTPAGESFTEVLNSTDY